jgi:stage II sporulation protein D
VLNAVRQTRGEILTYRGSPIEAVHFASSGGHTANNEDVWQAQPLPYLRGKADPYDSSPYAQWRGTIPRTQLLDVLSRTYGFAVQGFVLGDRGVDNRVRTIDLLRAGGDRRTVSSNAFRMLVSRHFGVDKLRSTMFSATREGDLYVFTGSGYGHGVGLSQWGAHAMAKRGLTYREILAFYFTGVSIDRLDGVEPIRVPEVASTPPRPETEIETTATATDADAVESRSSPASYERPGVPRDAPSPRTTPPEQPERDRDPEPQAGRRLGW